jgi:predicted RNA-binding Zn ribbon-like protein
MISLVDANTNRQWRNFGWEGEPDGPPRLAAGRLCLDFGNTVGGRGTGRLSEFLTCYPALISWAWYAGALTDDEAERLRQIAREYPEQAKAAHRQAISFRDMLYRVFLAIGHGEVPSSPDVNELTRLHRVALDHARLRPQETNFVWEWDGAASDLERPIWSVAWSAVDLLTTGDLTRIKVCPGGDGSSCQWLFYDDTKNRIRRWCSMENCGSTAKSRRQNERRRKGRQAQPTA